LCNAEKVTVKYYERKGLIKNQKYAEVLLVDDQTIIHYDNDEEQPLWPLYVMSGVSFLLGTGTVWIVAWSVKNNRRKQAIRDRKIIKKYGSFRK